jgi:hypothetical protein
VTNVELLDFTDVTIRVSEILWPPHPHTVPATGRAIGFLMWIKATAAGWRHLRAMSYRMLGVIMAMAAASCAPELSKTPLRTPSNDEGNCVSYGFVPGTTAYTNCVQREIDARRSGKLGPTYDQRLIAPRPAS